MTASDFHESAGILIRARNTGRFLLQRRGPAAWTEIGTWDLSGGGRLHSGEQPLAGGFRRLAEEIGPTPAIAVPGDALRVLHTLDERRWIYHVFEGWCESEFSPEIENHDLVSDWTWTSDPLSYELHPSARAEITALESARDDRA